MHETVEFTRYDQIVIHNRLEELDRKITSKMLAAEDGVIPSKTARSHEWSPALVQIQQKPINFDKYFDVSSFNTTCHYKNATSFVDEAKRIDDQWNIPLESVESLTAALKEARKEAKY